VIVIEPVYGWVDEMAQWQDALASYVPEPKRGGTWLYCRHAWQERSYGGVTRHVCLFRTKRLKTYRRHWRRHHR
jgi:hypothetical protein